MKRLMILCVYVLGLPLSASAQDGSLLPQFLQTLKPRCIGPANMSGRICEVAVYESEPRIMYVGSAAGGLWKTVNNGTTWKNVFEKQGSAAIGAVAVGAANPDLVWVGTGESNARNSVSWGDGVYKSTDGGKTWKHMGLKETQQIGRIIIHPKQPDTVYVAALGKFWGANKERGVFKTTDAGKTWEHVLAVNENAGCVDLALDPEAPEVLYAACYCVRRDAFSGGNPAVQTGPGSGLYKTTDGGKTWKPMTEGLPKGPYGRCGLSIYRKDPKVVFAVVQTDKTTVTVQGQPANGKLDLDAGGIFRSDDKGATWTHINSLVPRPFYYGQIRVDPNDEKRLYVLGVSFHLSNNGGKTFAAGNSAPGTHVDYHALWINPRDSNHLVLGCDGGVNFSYDKAATWEHLKNLPVSQFYAIGVDNRKPYRVYGGLQDNGSWGGPSATRNLNGISPAQWFNILGFDGYYCQVHPKDDDIVYCEGQYGILRRNNVRTGSSTDIKPYPTQKNGYTNLDPPMPKGTPAFRFNWSSPILQSPYHADELFYGGNYLFASKNRGDTWLVTSPDLTRGKPGPSAYNGHSITTIAASPLEDHVLYIGTDDGNFMVCTEWRDRQWTDLSATIPKLPEARWISRLEASRFDKGTVYMAVDRHRNDDLKPYLFKSTDRGRKWTSIVANLPESGPVYVIREDPVNKNLLYVGTEVGLFISLDAGKNWHRHPLLPTVPVHDLVVHPRDRELVIGTHGLAIWIMDVLPLQEMTEKIMQKDMHMHLIRPATAYRQRTKEVLGVKQFYGENPPYGAGIYCYFREKQEVAKLAITDAKGTQLASFKVDPGAGLHRVTWRLNQPKTKAGDFDPVPVGTYTAVLQVGDKKLQQTFHVEVDD